MKVDWKDVKTAIERGLRSAGNEDHHAMRTHCRAGHRMASHARGKSVKSVVDSLHRASRSIDLSAAVKHMETALEKVESEIALAAR